MDNMKINLYDKIAREKELKHYQELLKKLDFNFFSIYENIEDKKTLLENSIIAIEDKINDNEFSHPYGVKEEELILYKKLLTHHGSTYILKGGTESINIGTFMLIRLTKDKSKKICLIDERLHRIRELRRKYGNIKQLSIETKVLKNIREDIVIKRFLDFFNICTGKDISSTGALRKEVYNILYLIRKKSYKEKKAALIKFLYKDYLYDDEMIDILTSLINHINGMGYPYERK